MGGLLASPPPRLAARAHRIDDATVSWSGPAIADLGTLEAAAEVVHAFVQPTAQICWPLLSERSGCELWVKHENHTPIGSFKARGALTYLGDLKKSQPGVSGVIAATTGNFGQAVAFAATSMGLKVAIVVPHGNSLEKNAAMRAFGGELAVHGRDFDEAYDYAFSVAEERGLHMMKSFHPLLVRGVASYGLEFLRAAPELDTVYVPIGLGSGICGMIAAREALGLKTRIVGVVAEKAATYALSFERGEPVATDSADTVADGMAVRVPDADALAVILKAVERIVTLSEDEIRAAMRYYFTDTHNVAEGAGAAPLAALLKEREKMAGKRVGLILSGGNIDREVYLKVLAEG